MAMLPEFNFIDVNPESIINEMIKDYEDLTGRRLAEADPIRLFILAQANRLIQLGTIINDTAKQNLLYYAREDVLELKGYEWDEERGGNDPATTTMRFVAAIVQNTAKTIPAGTMVTPGDETFFITTRDVVIQPNSEYVDVEAVCTTPGTIGNGYQIGEISTMVQPLVYISHCLNLTETEGGTELEDIESYRERIHQAPKRLLTAGTTDAYETQAKSASAAIGDVHAYKSAPGEVTIKVLLKNGDLPGVEILNDVEAAVTPKNVRPLTDSVSVGIPDVIEDDLDLTYYLPIESTDLLVNQAKVEQAIEDYKLWQSEKMGRHINPSKLVSLCMAAGATRVDVRSPSYTVVNEHDVAKIVTTNIVFGGVEND